MSFRRWRRAYLTCDPLKRTDMRRRYLSLRSSACMSRGAPRVAMVDENGIVADELSRLRLSTNMDPADAMFDLANRFRQHLRRLQPAAVALMNTTRYRGWS